MSKAKWTPGKERVLKAAMPIYRFMLFGFLRDGADFNKVTPFDLGQVVSLHPGKSICDKCEKYAVAAIRQSIPAGVVVPREPTDEMCDKAARWFFMYPETPPAHKRATIAEAYKAMLAAAPKQARDGTDI